MNYAELALSDGSPVDNIGFSIAINELKRRLASLRSGENELLPTPTPGLWTTYHNEDYGYSIETGPDWNLDEETEDGKATFWTEDSTGLMEIITYELTRNSTLEELAESEKNLFEDLSLQESWDLFETKAFQRREAGNTITSRTAGSLPTILRHGRHIEDIRIRLLSIEALRVRGQD